MTTTTREYSDRAVVRPDLLSVLEDGGYRITQPRLKVMDLLAKKQEGFSTDEICDELPDVGRATVFRTIKLMVDAGVICRLSMPDGTPKYSVARVDHHHHTVCVECNGIGEFKHFTIERLLRTLGREISGEIVGHRIDIYIVCEECGVK